MPETAPAPEAAPTAGPTPAVGARSLITVLQPDAAVPLDRLGPWLEEVGAELRVVRLCDGEAVPALAGCGDGLVVLGGAMSAHSADEHAWIPGLSALLREAVEDGLPVLAICLGAQIAAEALGGRTLCPARGQGETGAVGLVALPGADGDPVLGPAICAGLASATGALAQDGGLPVVADHGDAVGTLPPGARLLAATAACPIHIWRAGSLLALQQHPEVLPTTLADWAASEPAREAGSAWRHGDDLALLPSVARPRRDEVLAEAAAVEPVTQAFGRALAAAFAVEAERRMRAGRPL